MYDKLGDLLKERLLNGDIDDTKSYYEGDLKTLEQDFQKSEKLNAENNDEQNPNLKKKVPLKFTKKITKELSQALHFFDISFSASEEELKKSYREKLKYYHPDKYKDNKILKKISTEKTREIVETYKLICSYME